jgi:uncharacterized membrane protein YgcG
MSKALTASLALSLVTCAALIRAQDQPSTQPFSADQLDNLLAPIALYPDPLLAQVLLAAAFPDQVDEAARFRRGDANPDDIDTQPWDVSVKAVAHYPTVLNMMADSLDWTAALGQAYVNQSEDVMASVQRLRQEARDAGNLATTPQQDVELDNGDIEIWPAQPQYCYVPVYDASLAFFGSGGAFGGSVVTFGAGFPIGVWLNSDVDWRRRRIYYHAWTDGHGWIARSRPFIHINNVYVNQNIGKVAVNRSVSARPLNYASLTRYNSVHRNVSYGNARANAGAASPAPTNNVNNKIIQRNGNVGDARIEQYRGHVADTPTAGRVAPAPTPAPAPERTGNAAFGANRGNFDAKASSQRGQASRASRPAPAPRSGGGGGGGSHGGGGGGSHGGGGRH